VEGKAKGGKAKAASALLAFVAAVVGIVASLTSFSGTARALAFAGAVIGSLGVWWLLHQWDEKIAVAIPALIAALFVAVGTGLFVNAITNKARSSRRQRTITQVSTTTTTETVAGASKTKTITVTQASSGGGPPPKTLEWLSDVPNPPSSNLGALGVKSAGVTVGGMPFPHTVQLNDPLQDCQGDPSDVSFPVPSGAKHLSGNYGWADSAGSAVLLIYADSPSGKPLWQKSFSNPGLGLTFSRLDNITGAHTIVFELISTGNAVGDGPCDTGTFLLADAQFTS
jgi:hypothetical protein